MRMGKHDRKQNRDTAPAASEGAGVSINLVSRHFLTSMTTPEKIRFILDEVKKQKILVLESGLDPREEAELIQKTMSEVDPDTFIGIEMQSQAAETPRSWMEKLLARTAPRGSMTVVGPADKLRTVHKDGSGIQALVLASQQAAAVAAKA
jgi:hypothetical protein